MGAPQTIWNEATDTPLATFGADGSAVFASASALMVGGATSPDGSRILAEGAALTPVRGTKELVLPGDVASTSNAAFTDVTPLAITLTPGTWVFDWTMTYTGSSSGASGIVSQLGGTGTLSSLLFFLVQQGSNSSIASFTKRALTDPANATTATTAGTEYLWRIYGRAVVTATAVLTPQFECSAGATTTTVKAGSYVRYGLAV